MGCDKLDQRRARATANTPGTTTTTTMTTTMKCDPHCR